MVGTESRTAATVTADDVWAAWADVRARRPLVHCITNYVAMDIAANVLLAAGASPAMVSGTEEVEEFAPLAGALTVNIGTLSGEWVAAMTAAVRAATAADVPWVLDPVAVGATTYRTRAAADLLARGPDVVRANASEVLALAGATDARGHGVDAVHAADDAVGAAQEVARAAGTVVAVTGEVDRVTDGERTVAVHGGHRLMPLVTALGCSATALVGAFLAVRDDAVLATASALAVLALAGERAAVDARGPGSLRWRLLDELHTLDEAAVRDGVRLG